VTSDVTKTASVASVDLNPVTVWSTIPRGRRTQTQLAYGDVRFENIGKWRRLVVQSSARTTSALAATT